MAIYKVSDDVLIECKKCLLSMLSAPKEGEKLNLWMKRRNLARKKSLKLIELLEDNYGV